MSRRPPAVHALIDMDPVVAVVRCSDGDVETFSRLAAAEIDRQGVHLEYHEIAPPAWEWFRISPCNDDCGEHSWHIDQRTGPGRGNWRGSYVRLVRREGAEVAPS